MRAVTVVAVVAVVMTVVAAGTGGAIPAAIQQTSSEGPTSEARAVATNHTNVSFGSQLSSFMQSSASQAAGSVENGMWEAAYENASNRTRRSLIDRRTNQLSQRISDLQAQKRALQAAKRNGSISTVEYRSRLSQIVGQLAALNEGIETVDRPGAPGVNRTKIADLNNRADRLAGKEVSQIARDLGGPRASPGPPEWLETGPDDDDKAGNRSDGGPPEKPGEQGKSNTSSKPDDTGPPDDGGNDTPTGPSNAPDNAGNSSESGNSGNDGNAGDAGSDSNNSDNGSAGGSGNGDGGRDNAGNGSDDNPGQGSDGNGSDNANDQGSGNGEGKGNDNGSDQGNSSGNAGS